MYYMHRRFNYPTRESLGKMTNHDAYEIQLYLAELEFPRIFSVALGFALFKVRRFFFTSEDHFPSLLRPSLLV